MRTDRLHDSLHHRVRDELRAVDDALLLGKCCRIEESRVDVFGGRTVDRIMMITEDVVRFFEISRTEEVDKRDEAAISRSSEVFFRG